MIWNSFTGILICVEDFGFASKLSYIYVLELLSNLENSVDSKEPIIEVFRAEEWQLSIFWMSMKTIPIYNWLQNIPLLQGAMLCYGSNFFE